MHEKTFSFGTDVGGRVSVLREPGSAHDVLNGTGRLVAEVWISHVPRSLQDIEKIHATLGDVIEYMRKQPP